jgi:hypothetical protein
MAGKKNVIEGGGCIAAGFDGRLNIGADTFYPKWLKFLKVEQAMLHPSLYIIMSTSTSSLKVVSPYSFSRSGPKSPCNC